MGYTHYWKIRKPFTNEGWAAFVKDIKNLFNTTTIPIANGHGDVGTKPIINNKYIAFNGEGDDSCETCYISREVVDFSFCKTRGNFYDSVVVKALKLARKHNPSIELRSDGGPEIFD